MQVSNFWGGQSRTVVMCQAKGLWSLRHTCNVSAVTGLFVFSQYISHLEGRYFQPFPLITYKNDLPQSSCETILSMSSQPKSIKFMKPTISSVRAGQTLTTKYIKLM